LTERAASPVVAGAACFSVATEVQALPTISLISSSSVSSLVLAVITVAPFLSTVTRSVMVNTSSRRWVT
jgi:hypothetical protein